MNVTLNNIGIISHADIKIKAITVVAGENGTGKSTINKALYSIFNASYQIEEEIEIARKKSISQLLYSLFFRIRHSFSKRDVTPQDIENLTDNIFSTQRANVNKELLENQVREVFNVDDYLAIRSTKLELDFDIEQLYQMLKLSDEVIYKEIVQDYVSSEFSNQINRFGSSESSSITLKIKEREKQIHISRDEVSGIEGGLSLYAKCIYIDNIGGVNYFDDRHHQSHLKELLLQSNEGVNVALKALTKKKLHHIMQLLNEVCKGELSLNSSDELSYKEESTGQELDLINTAAGLKIFLTLKRLLTNGTLSDRGLVLFDEPEIHLHPKWQIVLAQLIVLIQKEFNLHVLISTHSPYFLQAIEVYSELHGISEDCCYYLSEKDNNTSYTVDVTNETDKIYKKLAEPFQVMANLRANHEKQG